MWGGLSRDVSAWLRRVAPPTETGKRKRGDDDSNGNGSGAATEASEQPAKMQVRESADGVLELE